MPPLLLAGSALALGWVLLPDYVVMITTLGGMAVFGINGFIIGPTIAAMFIAVWHLSIAVPPPP